METPQTAKIPAPGGRWLSNNGFSVLDPDRRGLAGCRVAEVDLHAARGAVAVADDRVRPARHQYDLVEAVHARQAVLDDHAAARGAVDDRKRAIGVRRHVPVAVADVDERGRIGRGSRSRRAAGAAAATAAAPSQGGRGGQPAAGPRAWAWGWAAAGP